MAYFNLPSIHRQHRQKKSFWATYSSSQGELVEENSAVMDIIIYKLSV